MDFEGWELLPSGRHLDFDHGSERGLLLCEDIVTNYFSSHKDSTKEEAIEDDGPPPECKDIEVDVPSPPPSIVAFKKDDVREFAGIKTESPKATTEEPERVSFKSEVDVKIEYPRTSIREPENTLFDSETEEEDGFYEVEKNSEKGIDLAEPEIKAKHPSWVVGGVGALCSVGMAAATICIFLLSKGQLRDKHQHRQNQKIQFEIYADDKGINQVVQQASRLNHAISMTRAHISFGGYYDGI